MRPIETILADNRVRLQKLIIEGALSGYTGRLRHPFPNTVIFSIDGDRWEHASFSFQNRCPTWDEMCEIKDIFWGEDETVIQFHPKKSAYINVYPYALHLWKKIGEDFELPDN